MKKTMIAALLALCASVSTSAATFEALPGDTSLRALVGRWVETTGKKMVWEAEGNASIDHEALNEIAKLRSASSLEEALTRLNRSLEAAREANPKKPGALMACVFNDAIVIREVEQPACGLPR